MDTIEQLIQKRNDAHDAFKKNEKEVVDAITNFLNMHCVPEGVEIIVALSQDTPWSYNRDKGDTYCYRGYIRFKTDNPKRIADGYTYDFGSDFNIDISPSAIRINKGTCGEYSLEDKFQVARDRMIYHIWENHDAIIEVMTSRVRLELNKEFRDVDRQIDNINNELERQERERQRGEALLKLKGAKYICCHKTSKKYDENYEKQIGTHHHFFDIFTIKKITEKSVLGSYENYRWENKRLELRHILYGICNGDIIVGNEIPQDYDEPFEEVKESK